MFAAAVTACFAAGASKAELYFDRPADFFEETFVIGNGSQGATVYGRPHCERLSLNDITFWTGEPDTAVFSPGAYKVLPDIRAALDRGDYELAEKLQQQLQGHYTANYQPVGNLYIDYADKTDCITYSRTLNLEEAVANCMFSTAQNHVMTAYFASAPDSVIVAMLGATNPMNFVPANLQGLWNESLLPPWSSNYTTNINVEENYWPAEVTNLGEQHMPLLAYIRQLPETGRETAREYYGAKRGWCLGHNSDIWAITNPVGLNTANPQWANWNMGGAWIASHIWEHYLFSRDLDFLSEYYPTLRGAAEFCLDWLVEDVDGHLITSPATSPENSFKTPQGKNASTTAGGFADIAMLRQCLEDTRAAALVLDTDADLVAEISEKLKRLLPYRTGSRGQLQEWKTDYEEVDPEHRHQSHLYGLYPGHHITLAETPELAAAAKRTLDIKGDNTTGWSTGWRVNLLARLGEGERAYAMYRRLLKYVSPDKYDGPDKRRGGGTYPNLLDAHSPFQIDGNFGGTAGVAEMLIQSTPESISLLPALPQAWSTGSFKGLRTRTGHTVDARWRDGRVTSVTLSLPVDYAQTYTDAAPESITLTANGRTRTVLLTDAPLTINY